MTVRGIAVVAAFLLALVGATHALAQTDNSAPPDWITVSNQPCKVWNPRPVPNEAVTWSGECRDGLASGQGVLRWTVDGRLDAIFEGTYANGRRNGPGVLTTADGRRIEGQWFNDELLTGGRDSI
jgi:hypothetical protein